MEALRVSNGSLKMIVDALRSSESNVRRTRRLWTFLHGPEASNLAAPPGSEWYSLDVIPLLVEALEVEMGCREWNDILEALPPCHSTAPAAPLTDAEGSQAGPPAAAAKAPQAPGEALVSEAPPAPDYSQLSHQECVALLQMKDQEIAKLRDHAQSAVKRARRYYHGLRAVRTRTTAQNDSEKPLLDAREDDQDANAQFQLDRSCGGRFHKMRQGRYLTPNGSVAVAIRRNFGNVAGADFGHVLLDDVSRFTVHRCEVKAASALMASAHSFYAPVWAWLNDDTDFNLTTHAFRSDATNSGIWQRQKLCALELESAYLEELPASRDFSWDWQFLFNHQKRLADIQPVADGSGPGTIGMLLKALSGLGCPTWQDLLDQDESGKPVRGIHWYCFTSDCGADQVAAKKALQVDLQHAKNIIFIGADCLEHQDHLIALGALKHIDAALKHTGRRWKYFSSLAKISNVWRDNSPAIYREWTRQHGVASAFAHARALIPKCCAGRWQSVETQEVILHAAGMDNVLPVFQAVMSSKAVPKQRCAGSNDTEAVAVAIDELAVEQTQAYTEKLGRWRRDALEVMQDLLFWKVICMMTWIRPPCTHLSHFLKKQFSSSEVAEVGAHMVQLATGKAESIAGEFNSILALSSWQHLCDGLEIQDARWLTNLAGNLIIYHAAAFDRRIVQKVLQYPFKLFKLIVAKPQVKCGIRQAIARELLELPEEQLDMSTRKIRDFYSADLRIAAEGGHLGLRLWVSLRAVGQIIKADVRENECINKMITLLSDRAPKSSLELMSSRICLKHYLGTLAGPKHMKWSSLRPVAAALSQTCLSHWHEAEQVQVADRFAAPRAPAHAKTKQEINAKYPKLIPTRCLQHQSLWGACYNLLWHRGTKQDRADGICIALVFGKLGEDKPAYVCAEKSYSTGRMLVCDIIHETQLLRVRTPMTFVSSVELFTSWYGHVHDGPNGFRKVFVRKVPYEWGTTAEGLQMHAACDAASVMFKLSHVVHVQNPRAQHGEGDQVPFGGGEAVPAATPGSDEAGEARTLEEMLEQIKEDGEGISSSMLESSELKAMADVMMEEMAGFHDQHDDEHDKETKLEGTDLCEGIIRRREQDLVDQAVRNGARLDGSALAPAVANLLDRHPDMTLEEAYTDAALSSEQVIGNVSYTAVPDTRPSDDIQAYRCWLEAADEGIRVLLERATACQTVQVGENRQLSMVASFASGEGGAVMLVNWVCPETRQGRIASLDHENRIKWTMPVGPQKLPTDFSFATIVHPAVGVRMVRLRGPKGVLRPSLPVDMQRLMAMWRTAQSAQDRGLLDNRQTSSAAGSADTFGDACKLCGSPEGNLILCAVCQLTWHWACAEQLVRRRRAIIGNLPRSELELPEEFVHGLGDPAR